MLTKLLIPLVALPATMTAAPAPADEPPVRVWLSRTDVVWPGDRVRVYSEAKGDGYLVVLHAEPEGRIRVLFPIDPIDDNFVRGGSRYEVLSRADREAITVYAAEGVGTVLAAFSRDPFRFDELAQGGHWDYRLPDTWWVNEDPESDLLALADRMASGVPFDYDVQRYGVAHTVAAYRARAVHYGYAYPTYAYPTSGVYLSVGFTFGVPYFAYSHVHPVCWDWYYCYPGGWYYYSPYAYYRPYYYGYPAPYYGYWRSPGYYYPYYPYYRDYPKYAGKPPSYYPQGSGVEYRRRPGAGAPAGRVDARGTAPEARRRTPATDAPRASSPAGQSGRRTTPAAGTPTAGGRRSVPVGGREAPQQRDGGRRSTGSQPSGERAVPAKPARPADVSSLRREAPAPASGRRPEVSRPTRLPERVNPTRGSVPNASGRGLVRQSTGDRAVGSPRQTVERRGAAPARPERVVPTRSIERSGRLRAPVTVRGTSPAQVRAPASRSVGGRVSLPTRVQPGAVRTAPRASSPRMTPRAPTMSAPRAPARPAASPRAPAPRRIRP